jgi:hypothetical protein
MNPLTGNRGKRIFIFLLIGFPYGEMGACTKSYRIKKTPVVNGPDCPNYRAFMSIEIGILITKSHSPVGRSYQ